MSLVTTDTLRLLYNEAQAYGHLELYTIRFWIHWLVKHAFPEEHWILAPESPASAQDSRRRVDQSIRYRSTGQSSIHVLLFLEAKKHNGTRQDMLDVEGQVHEASMRYCRDHGIDYVYGMTMIGTTARLFQFVNQTGFVCLFGTHQLNRRDLYIDADDANAKEITDAITRIRAYPPSAYPTFVSEEPVEEESDSEDDVEGSQYSAAASEALDENVMRTNGYLKNVARNGTIYWQDRNDKCKLTYILGFGESGS